MRIEFCVNFKCLVTALLSVGLALPIVLGCTQQAFAMTYYFPLYGQSVGYRIGDWDGTWLEEIDGPLPDALANPSYGQIRSESPYYNLYVTSLPDSELAFTLSVAEYNGPYSEPRGFNHLTQMDISGPARGVLFAGERIGDQSTNNPLVTGPSFETYIRSSDRTYNPSAAMPGSFPDYRLEEHVTWIFRLSDAVTVQEVTDALRSGNLRLGVSVMSSDGSIERFSTAAAVPIPAALWLMVSAFGGIALLARRRTRKPHMAVQ